MSWAEAVGNLNETVLSEFAQPITVTANGEETVIEGVFDIPFEPGQAPTENAFSRPDFRAFLPTAPFQSTGAAVGDVLSIDGVSYLIVDVLIDGSGITEAVVRPG